LKPLYSDRIVSFLRKQESRIPDGVWIPAYAGMTVTGGFQQNPTGVSMGSPRMLNRPGLAGANAGQLLPAAYRFTGRAGIFYLLAVLIADQRHRHLPERVVLIRC